MNKKRQQGFVLAAVLALVVLGSMVAVSALFRVQAEETASSAGSGSEQAWAAAMSGVAEAIRVAKQRLPGSLDWQDDPASFKDRLVLDDGSERWYFTVFSAADSMGTEMRFGLSDEAAKLNVHTVNEEMLARVPGMTPYLAQGLADFLDADNMPRPEGAEQEYYDALANPYRAINGPLSSLEELLLVRGFTTGLIYGEDANLNCRLDSNEDDGADRFPPDNKNGKLDTGLRQFLTVYSYDLNEDNDGVFRMDINSPNETFLMNELPAATAAYIEALRRNKVKLSHAAELLEAKAKLKDDKGKEIEMGSGVSKPQLPIVLENLTTVQDYFLPGLININTASAAVLQTIPEIDEGMAESIVSAREHLRPDQRRTPAWLYQEGLVDADVFKKIAPRLTARGYQYHFHVIGYGAPSGRYRVLEAVVDVSRLKPMVTYLRDITRFGLPFLPEPLKPEAQQEGKVVL